MVGSFWKPNIMLATGFALIIAPGLSIWGCISAQKKWGASVPPEIPILLIFLCIAGIVAVIMVGLYRRK